MFTDAEVALSMSHDRHLRRVTNDAQGLVNKKNADLREAYSEITMLRSALSKSQDLLRAEQDARIAVQEELAALKRMVLEAL
jgi:hypothetical protein